LPGLKDLKIKPEIKLDISFNPLRIHPLRIPCPGTLGIFVILITIAAFTLGYIRNELILTLLGAIFLAVLLYCFTGIFLLGILHRRRAQRIAADMVFKKIYAGEEGELRFSQGDRLFAIPGILVRYKLKLETLDHRKINHIVDLSKSGKDFSSFSVPERGAYYGAFDELLFLDAMGLFRLVFPIKREDTPRLLAAPVAAEEKVYFYIRSGGREKTREVSFRKTDELTENRPYVPGDDPRRINWKLYGHGPGAELYVREGESVPPSHSRLLILLDTQVDPALYNPEEGRKEIDMLCVNALAAIAELNQPGTEILLGYTGGKIQYVDTHTLAWPAALPLSSEALFPLMRESLRSPGSSTEDSGMSFGQYTNQGILILALPRTFTHNTALDKFLETLLPQQQVNLIFLHSRGGKKAKDKEEAGTACAAFYGGKTGVKTRRIISN